MKFARPKKVVFCNNKGGVGKTTLVFNVGVELSKKGYKVALIDLDPQCNLTLQSLGHTFYDNNLFRGESRTIYDVLRPKIEGSGDLDLSIKPLHVRDNLYILPGSIDLALYENLLLGGYNDAAAGNIRGYSDTSAIDRYLNEVGASEKIDIFLIDTSPSLGVLNRVIFLAAEYFAVPVTPDSYSVQGIRNLGAVFEGWKKQWKNTAKAAAVSGSTPSNLVLNGDALFIGYIINSFNVYAERALRRQDDWLTKIPGEVKTFLSEKHGRNGLVEKSWRSPLGQLQDIGQLTAISMENNLGVQEFEVGKIKELNLKSTKELQKKAITSLDEMSSKLVNILEAY
ncbi:MAG TPA: AAA family ATPase [Candidatus Saccharimonadales bacterium]|nr:AAA family ATPase [Candidatus Saccharimonadales bacterium]